MFLGQSMCLIVYFLKRWRAKNHPEDEKVPLSVLEDGSPKTKLKKSINPLLLAIPAMCDTCASSLMFVALTQVAPSVYQMLRGVLLIYISIFSKIFLKQQFFVHHYTSIVFVISGLTLVAFAPFIISSDNEKGG